MPTSFLGLVGTDQWTNEERPKSIREGMLRLWPNGDLPMTAFMAKGKNKRVTDPEFKYFDKRMSFQSGACAGVYSDATLGSAVTTAGTAGTVYYAKVAAAVAREFRAGHTALLVNDAKLAERSVGKVISSTQNGASSIVAVRLLANTNSGELNDVDYIQVVGNSNPEGGTIPDTINYKPDKFSSYTQIWRTPLSITRTQKLTKMRTGDQYKEMKKDAMLYHGIEMEESMLWSVPTEGTGDNGQPERTTTGGLHFLDTYASDNHKSYTTDSSVSWRLGGEDWLDETLEVFFRYGSPERLAICGSGALLGIQKLVKQSGNMTITSETGAYGLDVRRWTTPFGSILLKTAPLFTARATTRNCMFIYEPKNVTFNYITDTHFKESKEEQQAGTVGFDGTKEEYLTEGGFEWHFAETMGFLENIGQDPA